MPQSPNTTPRTTFEVDGKTVSLALPPPRSTTLPSVFLLGLPKVGSTLMNAIMEPLCRTAGLTTFAITQEMRNLGIAPKDYPPEARALFVPRGYAYVEFRGYRFPFQVPDFASGRTVMLVRDPRDMVVSLYFSIAKSHPEPGAGASDQLLKQFRERRAAAQSQDIASFVRQRARSIADNFAVLERRLAGVDHKVWRYEDIIFDKLRWTEEMLDYLDLRVAEKQIRDAVARNDITPDAEVTGKHIRKVTPGDHREKLDATTIAALNDAFASILRRHDYA